MKDKHTSWIEPHTEVKDESEAKAAFEKINRTEYFGEEVDIFVAGYQAGRESRQGEVDNLKENETILRKNNREACDGRHEWMETSSRWHGRFNKLQEQNKKLQECVEFYSKKENHKLIFDNENESRAEVYEKYKEYSIGDYCLKAIKCLKEVGEK